MKIFDFIDNWKLDIATILGSATSGVMYTLEHYGAAIGILLPTIISAFFAVRKHLLDEKLAKERHEQDMKLIKEQAEEALKEMRERHNQEMQQDRDEFEKTGKNNR